jgi:acyl carrier protein
VPESVAERLAELIDDSLRATDREPIGASAIQEAFLPDFLDSLSITALISSIEDEWKMVIEDEELVPEIFENVGSLDAFVTRKLGGV